MSSAPPTRDILADLEHDARRARRSAIVLAGGGFVLGAAFAALALAPRLDITPAAPAAGEVLTGADVRCAPVTGGQWARGDREPLPAHDDIVCRDRFPVDGAAVIAHTAADPLSPDARRQAREEDAYRQGFDDGAASVTPARIGDHDVPAGLACPEDAAITFDPRDPGPRTLKCVTIDDVWTPRP